jgi:NADH-quinone oxidoreductase subunit E
MTQSAPSHTKKIENILAKHSANDASALVNVLHDLQSELRYLPEEALKLTSSHLGLSAARVYEVATFYEGFHLTPRGEHTCTVCMGTACHVRGAVRLQEQLERDLGVSSGQTTKDLKFSLQEVNCVGACALGPLVIIDEKYHGNMTPSKLSKLVKTVGSEKEKH